MNLEIGTFRLRHAPVRTQYAGSRRGATKHIFEVASLRNSVSKCTLVKVSFNLANIVIVILQQY